MWFHRLPHLARQTCVQIEPYIILTEADYLVLFLRLGRAMQCAIVQTEDHLECRGPDQEFPLPSRNDMRWRGARICDKDTRQLRRFWAHLLDIYDEAGEEVIELTRPQMDMGLRMRYLKEQMP
jgi:hypothetical protein